MLLDEQGKGEQLFDILLYADGRGAVQTLIDEFVIEGEGGIEAEVDADVAVGLIGAVVELRAETGDADSGRLQTPGWVQLGVSGVLVFFLGETVSANKGGRSVLREPETPAHFELVGGIFVELLRGFRNGNVDAGSLGVGTGRGAVIVDEDALVGGRLGPVQRVGSRGNHAV